MSSSSPPHTVRTFATLDALSRAAARDLITDIRETLQTQSRYTLALAGGSTPKRLYELLASGGEGPVPWTQLHLFWGDERFVPYDHPKSNARMAMDTLVRHVPIPEEQVHPIPTQTTQPEAAAAAYTDTLRQHFDDRAHTFDTVLLGLGADGHTASLFPETGTPKQRRSDPDWVRAITAPPRHDISTRLTCTLPTLNGARRALFLVSGARKREVLSTLLNGTAPDLPAAQIQPRDARLWYADAAAHPNDSA